MYIYLDIELVVIEDPEIFFKFPCNNLDFFDGKKIFCSAT